MGCYFWVLELMSLRSSLLCKTIQIIHYVLKEILKKPMMEWISTNHAQVVSYKESLHTLEDP